MSAIVKKVALITVLVFVMVLVVPFVLDVALGEDATVVHAVYSDDNYVPKPEPTRDVNHVLRSDPAWGN